MVILIAIVAHAGESSRQCEAYSYRSAESGVAQTRTGYYSFTDHSVTWVPNGPKPPRVVYFTRSTAHLEILRDIVGDERYRIIMASRDPEAAAARALNDLVDAAPDARGLSAAGDSLAKVIAAVPANRRLPFEYVDVAIRYLDRLGIHGRDASAVLNSRIASREFGDQPVTLRVLDVPVIVGDVAKWQAGDESQVRVIRLYGRVPPRSAGRMTGWMRAFFHDDLAKLAQRLFGPERAIYDANRPLVSGTNQYLIDPATGGYRRLRYASYELKVDPINFVYDLRLYDAIESQSVESNSWDPPQE